MDSIREKEILDYLIQHKDVTHTQLCKKLHCSLSTLRRDLIRLEEKKLVRRVRGGVVLNENSNIEYSHSYRKSINIPQKKIIGELVRDFISPGMCLFLDSSSTVYQLIPYILGIPNLIVITNGLRNALLLSESDNGTIKVYMTGGEVKINTSTVISSDTDFITESFHFNIAIFSCRGIDQKGIYEASFSQAQMKRKMMEKADQKILLADSSKFQSTHFFKIGTFSDYDAIVTDKEPNQTYEAICEKNNVELIYPNM